MPLIRRASMLLKSALLWTALAIIILTLVLAALGFLTAALFIWEEAHLGPATAAALTALALLVVAGLVMLGGGLYLSMMRLRAPSLFDDTAGTIAMFTSLAGLLVRRDPKRALLLSLLAGALTEYFASAD